MKISGAFGTGLRVALYNAVAILLTLLLGVTISGPKGIESSLVDRIFMGLWLTLTFPTQFFEYEYKTATASGMVDFWFLSPLIWGATAFVIHKLVLKRRQA